MVDAEASVDENNEGATIAAVTTENATDGVTVSGDDRFEVADGNLKLKDGESLDFESDTSPIEVTLTASGDGESAEATVTVTVNDVNEAPTIEVADGETPDGMAASSTIDENMAGALLGAITLSDPDAGQTHTLSTSDPARFVTKQDAEGGWWLALADGVSLDHEAGATVTVTVTVTDDGDGALSDSTEVTITVNDVNEAPMASGMVDTVAAEAGERLDAEIDLAALFSDPDGSDDIVRWELSGNPDWLGLEVEYVDDGNGGEKAVGRLRGEPPTRGPESAASHMVTLTATDGDGESGSIDFYVVVDDGNDAPTGINLINDAGRSVVEVEVNEGDASGVVFGEITVDDIDDSMHPHGQHMITVSDDRFEIRVDNEGGLWLALKEGVSLDRERESGNEVLVTLRAIDINGEKDEDGDYKGLRSDPVTFAVVINDQNDAPRAGSIGNWWATIDEDLEAEDVSAGQWLRFSLETAGDRYPAFTDQDLKAGDSLTYVLSGPSWLQIDADSGEITNVEGVIPNRGVYRVTITATDEDDQSASKSFNLNVAVSREADDGTLTRDNYAPRISRVDDGEYDELSGNQPRVAMFQVTDTDQDIPDHQFALKTAKIIKIENPDNAADPNNVALRDHDGDDDDNDGIIDAGKTGAGGPATPMKLWTSGKTDSSGNPAEDEGYAAAIQLSDPSKNGNVWTYYIEVADTDRSPLWDTTWLLDPEANTSVRAGGVAVSRLDITVAAIDGTEAFVVDDAPSGSTNNLVQDGTPNESAAHDEIRIDIEDINEAPAAPRASSTSTTALVRAHPATDAQLAVGQEEAAVKLLYINLEELWEDPDSNDNDGDLTFRASSSVSWIEIKYGPIAWDEIENEPGIAWPSAAADMIGSAPTAGSDTMVVVVEIDRTERHDQGDSGSFTLTATDDERNNPATGSRTYKITPEDEDINIESDAVAVTIGGGVREDGTLRANFDDNEDPDLAGGLTPAVVLYTWYRVDVDANGDPDLTSTPAVIVQSTSNTYTPTQSDVNHFIGVVVNYYEPSALDLTVNAGPPATVARAGEQLTDNALAAAATVGNLAGDASATPNPKDPKAAITSVTVANTPDRGTADITILADSDKLMVPTNALRIVDGDYPRVAGVSVVPEVNETDAQGAVIGIQDLTISFEVSANGRGGWTAVDEDDVSYNATDSRYELDLKDGEGNYYRAVASYNADTGTDPATERVVSDPIQVANVRDDDSPVPTPRPAITGSANPGGTLSVDAGSANVTVQWQMLSGGNWVDIAGATGDLRLTQAHAGKDIRAVVSYQSRDPDNPGITNVVVAEEAVGVNLDNDGTTTVQDGSTVDSVIDISGSPSNIGPVKVQDYEIEGSVDGTGHAAVNGLLAGHNATITHTVPLTSLFQDPDTPGFLLSFSASGAPLSGGGAVPGAQVGLTIDGDATRGSTYVYDNAGGVLIFEAKTGKVTYLSDQYRGHDGNDADGDGSVDTPDEIDGAGNVITLNVQANDIDTTATPPAARYSANPAEITLRINVAPTDIHFAEGDTASGDLSGIVNAYTPDSNVATQIAGITVNELVEATGREVLAEIDVQDENWAGVRGGNPGHKFGTHEVTVVGDDRFVITKNGGPTARRDDDSNGSTWELRLKKGATFDHETDDMDPHTKGTQIELTFMASDGGGLSTPDATGPVHLGGNGYNPIKLVITVANNPADDPPRPGPKETPGLKDNNESNDMDDTTDDGTDSETDGGDPTPPPPGMSLGGIIEDFIDNMDGYDQDLLEDFLLTIDDSLDIV